MARSSSSKSRPSKTSQSLAPLQHQRVLFNVLLAVFVPALFFSLCELGARGWLWWLAGRNPETYRMRHYQLAGEVGYFYAREKPSYLFHELGFKNSDYSKFTLRRAHGQKKQFRILMLGGSAVAGGEKTLHSWPYVMEFILRRENPDLDIMVVNGGIWAGISANERLQVFNLRNYDWDLIVNYSGYNDMHHFLMVHEEYLLNLRRTNQHLSALGRFWHHLKEHSVALSALSHVYVKNYHRMYTLEKYDFVRNVLPTPEKRQQFLDGLGIQLEDIFNMTAAQDVPVLHIFQGSYTYLRQFRPLLKTEWLYRRHNIAEPGGYWDQRCDDYLPAMESYVQGLCDRYPQVTYVNFIKQVKDETHLYEDDVHFTSKGTIIIAEMVAKIIQTKYLKRSYEHWARYVPNTWQEPKE